MEGKNQLRAEIREAVNQPLGIHTPAARPVATTAEAAGEGVAHAAESKPAAAHATESPVDGVLEVLLTSFVIQ